MRRHAGDGVERGPVDGAEAAVAEIQRYREIGITFLPVGFDWHNAVELSSRLRWFAAEVMPAFRATRSHAEAPQEAR
jgi:hypothetical protein